MPVIPEQPGNSLSFGECRLMHRWASEDCRAIVVTGRQRDGGPQHLDSVWFIFWREHDPSVLERSPFWLLVLGFLDRDSFGFLVVRIVERKGLSNRFLLRNKGRKKIGRDLFFFTAIFLHIFHFDILFLHNLLFNLLSFDQRLDSWSFFAIALVLNH